jgi:hypothetical protein
MYDKFKDKDAGQLNTETKFIKTKERITQSKLNEVYKFLISNFRNGLKVLCFLLGNSPAPEVYVPTFRNTLFHFHRQVGVKNDWV